MHPFSFLKNPLYAIIAIAVVAAFLFFPILLVLLFFAGWIYETFIKKKEPIEIKPVRTTPSSYSSPNLDRWTTERYHTYLKSPEWKEKVLKVKARDQVCQLTGATTNLEVHHITYDRLGNEDLSDLVLLCREAHQLVHDYYGSYSRDNTYPIEPLKALL